MGNVGTIDRLLRLIIGAGLIAAPFMTDISNPHTGVGTALVVIGAIFVLTAAFKFCPVYSLFGWRTSSKH